MRVVEVLWLSRNHGAKSLVENGGGVHGDEELFGAGWAGRDRTGLDCNGKPRVKARSGTADDASKEAKALRQERYRGWLMPSTPRDEVPCSWAHREVFDSGRLQA